MLKLALAVLLVAHTPPPVLDVEILSPDEGEVVSGTIAITGTSSDVGSGKVSISIDGGPFVPAQGTDSWTFPWNTAGVADGPHEIRARARMFIGGPEVIDTVHVDVQNGGGGVAVSIAAPSDGELLWGPVVVTGGSSGATSVDVRIDTGPFQPADGADPWTFALDATSLTSSSHAITARANGPSGATALETVQVIVNPESPPAPACGSLFTGSPLPFENPIAPVRLDLGGPSTVDIHIIGHSENRGYDDELQAMLDAAPPGGHQYAVTNHWIGGHELWRWVTPGQQGHSKIEALLAGIDGPAIALVLVSNNTSFPIQQPVPANASFQRFVDECGQLADHLTDGGDGVLRVYFSAHRMKPQNLMPCWHENLAMGEVMAQAAAAGRDRVKAGPEQHQLHWCCYPDCYAGDLAHTNDAGDLVMAETWYDFLRKELGGSSTLEVSGLAGGQTASFDLSGASPSAHAFLGAGLTGMGVAPIPALAVVADLDAPFLLLPASLTDAIGAVQWSIPVPAALAGLRLWFQVVQLGGKSNAVEAVVQ